MTYMTFQAAHNVADVNMGPRLLDNLRVSCAQCNLHSGVGVFDEYALKERDGAAFPRLIPDMDARKLVDTLYKGGLMVPMSLLYRDQCLYPGRRTGLDWIDTPVAFRT